MAAPIEVFFVDTVDIDHAPDGSVWEDAEPGWYYWYCFPGCLPESDPIGPFLTEEEAMEDTSND